MKLAFRYQFILAPGLVVLLLTGLIAYTLHEMSLVSAANEQTKNWEVLTDRIKSAITSVERLNRLVGEISDTAHIAETEQYFSYLEHVGIVRDTLLDADLLAQIPAALKANIQAQQALLQQPETREPVAIVNSLHALLPDLEYQYKVFVAQRRSNFIDNHRKIVAINARMTIVLLSGLALCIVLALSLSLWSFRSTRIRLQQMTERALAISPDAANLATKATTIKPAKALDELEQLGFCLTNMRNRLDQVISVEHVLRGAEEERSRIARDMHDGVLADMTAIARRMDSDPAQHALREEMKSVISYLRRTIDDLHPQVLETLGLQAAIESLLEKRSQLGHFPRYVFECNDSIETLLSMPQKLNIYRLVSEALNNVVKHANADRVEICLRRVGQDLVLSIEDNGQGMSDAQPNQGHGCANIKQRAAMLGASVAWLKSRFANGTCVKLILPLAYSPEPRRYADAQPR